METIGDTFWDEFEPNFGSYFAFLFFLGRMGGEALKRFQKTKKNLRTLGSNSSKKVTLIDGDREAAKTK